MDVGLPRLLHNHLLVIICVTNDYELKSDDRDSAGCVMATGPGCSFTFPFQKNKKIKEGHKSPHHPPTGSSPFAELMLCQQLLKHLSKGKHPQK